MAALASLLAQLFGHGDDDFPLWLLTVRINIVLLVLAAGCGLVLWASRARAPRDGGSRRELLLVCALTAAAAALRFGVARGNLLDQGGIPFSRLLVGYRGNFATAQLYSLVYRWSTRDIEHALWLDRLLGTLTVPALYLLARQLGRRSFAAIAAALLAFCPLHILFSASDALSISSNFLATVSFVLLTAAANRARVESLIFLTAAALGLALLTQVRYENSLFCVPAALYLWRARSRFAPRPLALISLLGASLVVAYGLFSLRAGLSFQRHTPFSDTYVIVAKELLGNPFLGIHFLLLGAALTLLGRDRRVALASLALWMVAVILTVATTESAHDAARIFANWLAPLILCAAYGYDRLARDYRQNGVVVVAILLAYQLSRPLAFLPLLTAPYAELADHAAFRSLVASLPPSISTLVVPDDELMKRSEGATVETLNQYALTVASPITVMGLTELLEQPGGRCRHDECAFYAGLPCEAGRSNFSIAEQCGILSHVRPLRLIGERTVTAASFAECSIAVDGKRRDRCRAVEHHFRLYAIAR